MFQIDKEFQFCYGHRVHNQQLDTTLSDGLCKCRHLHGHNGTLKIGLEAESLERGMVTDFKHLDFVKILVDDVFDHKFIVDHNDPLFDELFNNTKEHVIFTNLHGVDIGHISTDAVEAIVGHYDDEVLQNAIRDKLYGVVIVKFVPTSENLCKMFGDMLSNKLSEFLGERVRVSYVDFWETPKSHCRYTLPKVHKINKIYSPFVHDLEKSESNTEYKVGDKVTFHTPFHDSREGVIVSIDETDDLLPYEVAYTDTEDNETKIYYLAGSANDSKSFHIIGRV